jgi:dephospho-CoA kinase
MSEAGGGGRDGAGSVVGKPAPEEGEFAEPRSRPLLVGLTGGLASGKSTVAGLLAGAGFRVIDADRLVAELYRPGGAGAAAVAELLGPEALDEEGAVDRAAVAERVFADPGARRRLEAAIHPLVRRRFAEIAAAAAEPVAVLEATLLVEAGYGPDFDLVVTVEADPEVRLRRAVDRGLDPADARARLAAQGDGAARRAGADRVIENDGDLADLRRRVEELAGDLRARASADGARGAAGTGAS